MGKPSDEIRDVARREGWDVEAFVSGYQTAESDLAPAVRLADAALGDDQDEWLAACDAYRATPPARDPLKELAIVLGCMPGSENVARAMALLAQAMERRKK